MAAENLMEIYDEVEKPSIIYEVGVKDAGRFVGTMLECFIDKGTLYISSYDFGQWAGRLEAFRSPDKVRTQNLFVPPSILENGYRLTREFVSVFINDCLKNMDAANTLNQFVIFDKGRALLECYGNFELVHVNTKMPKGIVDKMAGDGIIGSWEKVKRQR
jgi:hypothetical protein